MTVAVKSAAAEPTLPPRSGAVLPTVSRQHHSRKRLDFRRKAIAAGAIAIIVFICLWTYDQLVTGLMHDQRQRHLASQIGVGKAQIHRGQPYGYLQVPSLGINEIVVEGVTPTTLQGGPAVTSSSVLPGQQGATVIFGHRSSYGGPFARLSSLKKGDSVFVEARNKAPVIEYRVIDVVHSSEGGSAQEITTSPGTSKLVLVTSGPATFGEDRVIVEATAVASVAGGNAPASQVLAQADDDGPSVGIELILANLGLGVAALLWKLMQTRGGNTRLTVVILSPVVVLTAIWIAQFAQSLLPLTR